MKYVNPLYGQSEPFLNINPAGIYNNHETLKDLEDEDTTLPPKRRDPITH